MKYENVVESLRMSVADLKKAVKIVERSLRKDKGLSLHCCGNDSHKTHYLVEKDTGNKRYMPADSDEIRDVAQISYYRKMYGKLQKQLKQEVRLLEMLEKDPVEKYFFKLSPRRQVLVNSLFVSDEEYARMWQAQTWNMRNPYEIQGNFYSSKGEHVRSKAEVIISDRAHVREVPYHYEKPIDFGNGVIRFPDFIFLNKRTRKVYIWEHFGMMDNEEYRHKAFKKISEYAKAGYVQGVNLIVTFEESNVPLDVNVVDIYIKTYLL